MAKNGRNISFEDYVKAVRKSFGEGGYTDAEINEYFNTAEVKAKLEDDYKEYTTEDPNAPTSGGHDPNAVAYCLDLMY